MGKLIRLLLIVTVAGLAACSGSENTILAPDAGTGGTGANTGDEDTEVEVEP